MLDFLVIVKPNISFDSYYWYCIILVVWSSKRERACTWVMYTVVCIYAWSSHIAEYGSTG